MTNLVTLVRQLIQDMGSPINDYHTYKVATLAGRTWELSEPNASGSTLTVYKNDVLLGSTNYTYNSVTNKVVINDGAMTLNDRIRFSFSAYKKYSDEEIEGYISYAFTWLSIKRYKDFYDDSGTIIPSPTIAERRLIGLIAAILIDGNLLSYKTKEFEVRFNQKAQLPEEKIEQLMREFSKCYGVFAWISTNGVSEE